MQTRINRFHTQIIVGAILVIAGFLISLFMVVGIIEKSFFLSFLSYSFSLAGVALGILAIYSFIAPKKESKRRR